MVVINTKLNKVYENLSKAEAARLIGVNTSTLFRWMKKSDRETYNHFELYFNTEKYKQPRKNGKHLR